MFQKKYLATALICSTFVIGALSPAEAGLRDRLKEKFSRTSTTERLDILIHMTKVEEAFSAYLTKRVAFQEALKKFKRIDERYEKVLKSSSTEDYSRLEKRQKRLKGDYKTAENEMGSASMELSKPLRGLFAALEKDKDNLCKGTFDKINQLRTEYSIEENPKAVWVGDKPSKKYLRLKDKYLGWSQSEQLSELTKITHACKKKQIKRIYKIGKAQQVSDCKSLSEQTPLKSLQQCRKDYRTLKDG